MSLSAFKYPEKLWVQLTAVNLLTSQPLSENSRVYVHKISPLYLPAIQNTPSMRSGVLVSCPAACLYVGKVGSAKFSISSPVIFGSWQPHHNVGPQLNGAGGVPHP